MKVRTHPIEQDDIQAAIVQLDCVRHGGHKYQFGYVCINCGFAPFGYPQPFGGLDD